MALKVWGGGRGVEGKGGASHDPVLKGFCFEEKLFEHFRISIAPLLLSAWRVLRFELIHCSGNPTH